MTLASRSELSMERCRSCTLKKPKKKTYAGDEGYNGSHLAQNSKALLEDGMNFSVWNRIVYCQSFVQKEPGRDCSHVPTTQKWDTAAMEHRTEARKRNRRSLQKWLQHFLSRPQESCRHKKKILEAIAKGELNPGEECCGTVKATYTLSEGELARKEVEVHGRKIPLLQLRKFLLKQHEAKGLMRPVPQVLEEYTGIPRNMVIERLRAIGEYQDNGYLQTDEELQTHLSEPAASSVTE